MSRRSWRQSCSLTRGLFRSLLDALLSATPAKVARWCKVDLTVVRARRLAKQGDRAHDLPGLAKAARGHRQIKPGLLHRVPLVRCAKALDGVMAVPSKSRTAST